MTVPNIQEEEDGAPRNMDLVDDEQGRYNKEEACTYILVMSCRAMTNA